MTIDAVIFDWGGTLTPWHTIDFLALWQAACAPHFPDDHERHAAAICDAELGAWELVRADQRSSTLFEVLKRAGVEPSDRLLASYRQEFEPHTFTDPAAASVLGYLRSRGIKIGVLSNTLWPRSWHEEIFRRDGVLDLIDGAVYSSEIDWAKPHPEAFRAVMAAVGATDPGRCVFIGDRPWDDVSGAKAVGMRAVLIPYSEVPSFDGTEPDAVIHDLAELPALIDAWSSPAHEDRASSDNDLEDSSASRERS
ncbi:MAG TPA: HAD family hydrolase [Streptosporangiaceae bacterium]|jgi:putative hydrolase of the HAD superfamily|nr:HAD family hydrolase [Streptosporangiaceae bacterium]